MNDPRLKDKLWRLTNFYKIRDKNKKLRKLKPNRIQETILKDIQGVTPVRHFTLKYRQGGVSTLMLLWWLDDTIFNKNTITGILADKRENLGYLWEIVRIAYKNMPIDFQPKVGDDSKTSMSFPDLNSKIFVSLSIKSTALHNLHISEWCFCDDSVIGETLAACSPSTNITGESTPHGVGNDGYVTYHDAKAGDNGYKALFIPWWLQDEYRMPLNGTKPPLRSREELSLPVKIDDEQILFRRMMKSKLKRDFLKFYPENDITCWLLSGTKFFDNQKLLVLLDEAKEMHPIEETEDYVMWEKPDPKHVYVAGADTAEGWDGDYCVLAILDVTARKQVFRFRARVGIDVFFGLCDEWCRRYNNAWLGVEDNNHGHAVLLGLREITRYPNLYWEKVETRYNTKIIEGKRERRYGWRTTITSRPLLLDQLKLAIEGESQEDEHNFEPEFVVCDQEFLKEGLSFEQTDSKKYEAAVGHHDDTIFAWGIAYQLYTRRKRIVGKTITSRIFVGQEREQRSDEIAASL